jgi:hypothetical protein
VWRRGFEKVLLTKQRKAEAGDSLSKRGERLSSALSSKNIPVSKSINSKGKILVDR